MGIAKTLTKQKRTDIVMVGFDMAEETKQFIKDPDYRGVSLMQKQDQMGYLGIGTLNSLINGKKSEQKYFDTDRHQSLLPDGRYRRATAFLPACKEPP